MDECISRHHTLLVVAQEIQLQRDQHQLVENDPQLICLYTPSTGRSNKLLPKHKGPYQVLGRKQSMLEANRSELRLMTLYLQPDSD